MQMPLNSRLTQAKEYPLVIYNGQAIINKGLRFWTVVECDDLPYEEIDFDFIGFVYGYFRVYNERRGRELLDLDVTQSGPYLIINASEADMTFDDNGGYHYEIGYSRDGYEQALRYGKLIVI